MPEITVKLPTLEKAIMALGNAVIEQGMAATSETVAGQYRRMWSTGKDSSGASNPPLLKSYRDKKVSEGGAGIANFTMNGNFTNSFSTQKLQGTTAIIGWPGGGGKDGVPYLKKARGLMSPNSKYESALSVSPKMVKIAIDTFNKWLRKVVKFQ